MTEDNEAVKREKRFQKQYRLWIENLALQACSCRFGAGCDSCRARAALKALTDLEQSAQWRKKLGSKKKSRRRSADT